MTLKCPNVTAQTLTRKAVRAFRTPLMVAASVLFFSDGANAVDYPSGAGALERFDAEARAALPPILKGWLMLLLGTFAASLIFVWKKVEARWAIVGLLFAMLAGPAAYRALGWPMLGGAIALSHLVCWAPVLTILVLKRPFAKKEHGKLYRIWTAMLFAVIAISFVFDVRDAWIYLQHIQALGA